MIEAARTSAPETLARYELYIDGRFGPAESGETFRSFDPFAGRDWAAWGRLVDGWKDDAGARDWQRQMADLRREVTAKMLLPVHWSPLQDVDLSAPPQTSNAADPAIHRQREVVRAHPDARVGALDRAAVEDDRLAAKRALHLVAAAVARLVLEDLVRRTADEVRRGPPGMGHVARVHVDVAQLRVEDARGQAQHVQPAAKILLVLRRHPQTFDAALDAAEIVLVGEVAGLKIVHRKAVLDAPSNAMKMEHEARRRALDAEIPAVQQADQ